MWGIVCAMAHYGTLGSLPLIAGYKSHSLTKEGSMVAVGKALGSQQLRDLDNLHIAHSRLSSAAIGQEVLSGIP